MAKTIQVKHYIRANITLRRLGWDEQIQAGDFHALSPAPNAVYPITERGISGCIGKTVTQWRRETKTDREFFRVEQPIYSGAVVDSHFGGQYAVES